MNKNSSSTQLTKLTLGNVGSISRHLEHLSLTTQSINNLSKSSTRQSRLKRTWLFCSAGAISSIVGYSLPAIAAPCVSSTISGTAITPFISGEVYGTSVNARSQVDTLDDVWRTAISPQTSPSWTGTATNPIANDVGNLFTINGVDVGVRFVNIDPITSCTGTVNTGIAPELNSSGALQSQAPRPASLYEGDPSTTRYWNDLGGSNSNRNAALFTFSRPVSAFGAWFGDLETRTIGGGTPAIMRLLDKDGKQIGGDILVTPNTFSNGGTFSTLNQNTCGSSGSPLGNSSISTNGIACGKNSTRWIGFVDTIASVKQVLVIVGDDDNTGGSADTTGKNERLSFIGVNLVSAKISGTVFEDVNYGGGAGRPLSTAGTSGRANARVEIYDGSGAFKGSVLTNSSGFYEFSSTNVVGGILPGNYIVRVVNKTVTSARTGYVNTLLPVQTFRTNGLTSNVGTPDPNRVGGEAPQSIDADNGSTTLPATAQSITSVIVGSADATGINFGFNFDTIVNTNNSGQGSLSQFILNSNALDNTLNQDPNPNPATGTTAIDPALGEETSIFMIPTAQLTTDGVANINITSLLPQITGTNANKTVIDGRTQTVNIGNNNAGTLGAVTISKVGVDRLTLDPVNRPEIQVTGLSTLAAGLDIQANDIKVIGISILKFGALTTINADINIASSATNSIITGNVIGATATSFTDPVGTRSNAYGIYSTSNTGTFTNNLIGFHGRGGIELIISSPNSGILIENNEVRGNAINDSRAEGTNVGGNGDGGGVTVRGNLFADHGGPGIDTSGSVGNNVYVNNTVTNNGLNLTGQSDAQTSGMRIRGSNTFIDRNIIYNNRGSGILVRDTSTTTPPATPVATTNVKITKNSIYGNGQIGIDLIGVGGNNDSGATPFVTLNDNSDSDAGGNGLLNFPVLESARMSGTNLVVKGFAPAGAEIELFISDNDPSNFGEGKTYLATVTEGTLADVDTATGSYGPAAVNGVAQGTETGANRFSFTIPLANLADPTGKSLTATATVGTTTSEFSGVVNAVTNNPQLVLVKRVTAVNGTAITTVVDDTRETTTAANDNNSKWPTPITNGISDTLKGSLTTSKVAPNQEIEYTIYFLSAGNVPIKQVNICDLIPTNTTYVTGSGSISFNGATSTPLTNEYKTGPISNTAIPGIGLCKSTVANPQTTAGLSATDNPNGLVWVEVDSKRTPVTLIAAGEYGYIRFRVLTNANNPIVPPP